MDRGSDAEFQKQIASYLDIDPFLRFVAANAYLVTLDNFFTNGHNYYLYLNPLTETFVFLPWDMDVSLAGVPFVGTAEQRMDLSLVHPHPGAHKLIDRLLAMKEINARYQTLLKELASTAFSRQRLLAQIDAIESVTTPRLAREKRATEARQEGAGRPGYGFAPGSGLFGQGPSLRTFVEKRVASVVAQLAGERKGYVPRGAFGAPGGGPAAELGGRFIVFHDKVQDELKLSDDQRKQLEARRETVNTQTTEFLQKLQKHAPEQQGPRMQEYQRSATVQLDAFLRNVLTGEQLQRLRELALQREGPFALLQPDVGQALRIREEQRLPFMRVLQDLQRAVEPLMKNLQSGGDPSEIGPKIQALRQEHALRLEAVLNETQRTRWKQMLGKPFVWDE